MTQGTGRERASLISTDATRRISLLRKMDPDNAPTADNAIGAFAGAQDALLPAEKIMSRMQSLVSQLTVRLHPDAGHVLVNTATETLPFLGQNQSA